jgi:predicted Zn-dependent protease
MKIKLQKTLQKVMVLVIMVNAIIGNVSSASAADPYLLGGKFNKTNLTYYISSTPSASDVPAIFVSYTLDTAIDTAFFRWNTYMNAYNINLTFSSTNNINDADIVFTMGSLVGAYGLTKNTPLNSPTYSKSSITLNDYTIYQHYLGGVLSINEIASIAMHEIGHAIGLAQISENLAQANNIYSIMVESIVSPYFSNITSFDIGNIRKLY